MKCWCWNRPANRCWIKRRSASCGWPRRSHRLPGICRTSTAWKSSAPGGLRAGTGCPVISRKICSDSANTFAGKPGSKRHLHRHFLCILSLSVRPSNATLALMKNVSPSYLKHHFLIAMPHMADPNFAHTLTYIVEHTANGAMGLVVNRPQDLNLADILEQLRPDIEPPVLCQHVPIFIGGPVQTDRGFVLHPSGKTYQA